MHSCFVATYHELILISMRHYSILYTTGVYALLCTVLYICSAPIGMDNICERMDLGFNNEIIDACDYLDYSDLTKDKSEKNNLTVLQLNICGVLNKQDKLKDLLNDIKRTVEWMLTCW